MANRLMIKFQEGDRCYVRGKQPDQALTVVHGFLHGALPHYVLRDSSGRRWTVSQLQMSSKPIKTR